MARAIRFTKAERELLLRLVSPVDMSLNNCGSKIVKTAAAIRAKLELSELPVKGSYLTVTDAISAFREVLGNRLVAPGFQAVGVLGQMKNRIQALGLTRADCVTIAKVAGAEWQGLVRAESLVRQADKLMANGQLEISTPHTRNGSPVELGEEDI